MDQFIELQNTYNSLINSDASLLIPIITELSITKDCVIIKAQKEYREQIDNILNDSNYFDIQYICSTCVLKYNHIEYDFNTLVKNMKLILNYRELILNQDVVRPIFNVSYMHKYNPIDHIKYGRAQDKRVIELFKNHYKEPISNLLSEVNISENHFYTWLLNYIIYNSPKARLIVVKYLIEIGYTEFQKYINNQNIYYFGTI